MEECTLLLTLNNSAFSQCRKLKSIKLPPKLVLIESGCFYQCFSLNSLILPDSLEKINGYTSIDFSTFGGALTSITIRRTSNLKTLGYGAFISSRLTYIYIPKSLTEISPSTFLYCKLERIEIDPENPIYRTDGTTVFKDNNSTLVFVSSIFSGVYHIPNYVTTLMISCFRGVPITNITFPESQVKFDSMIFTETSLTEFNCPSYLTDIPNMFFSDCHELITVYLSENTTKIREFVFYHCYKLANIVLPQKLERIEGNAFNSCKSLRSLKFPSSLSFLGEGVFTFCDIEIDTDDNTHFMYYNKMLFTEDRTLLSAYFGTDIKSVLNIPVECTSIGASTFYQKNLSKVTFNGEGLLEIKKQSFSQSTLVEIVLPSSLNKLGDECFSQCLSLTTVTFSGHNINSIPTRCFSGCTKLTYIQLPSSISSIGDYAFYQCSHISDIGIRNTQLSSLGIYSFSESSLTTFDYNGVINTVGLSCFSSSKLTQVTICVHTIPENCFSNCISLNILTLEDSIVTLNENCFYNCISLSSLTIPRTVESIKTFAFKGCSSLKTVILSSGSVLNEVYGGAFLDCDQLDHIDCNSDKHKFRNGALTDINETNLITFIPSSKITTFLVPSTMKSIGNYAFMGSKHLVRVIFIGDKLTDIGYMSFTDCTSLSFLYVPSLNLATIGLDAFQGCDKLRKCGSVQCFKSKQSIFIDRGIPLISFTETCSYLGNTCKNVQYITTPSIHSFSVFIIMIL